jgi:hypothetical protein
MFQQTLQHRLPSRTAISIFPTILSAILYLHSAQMKVRVFLSPSFSAPSLKYTNALYRRRKVFLFFVKQTLLSAGLPAIAFSVRLISLSVVPFSHLSTSRFLLCECTYKSLQPHVLRRACYTIYSRNFIEVNPCPPL